LIQAIIIVSLLLILAYAFSQQKRSPFVSRAISGVIFVGLLLTLFPTALQAVADRLGVGRGVDLMFYIVILAAFLAIVNLHVRMRVLQDSLRDLARAQALQAPHLPVDDAGTRGEAR
jgi:hypothetical protein